MTDRYIKPGDRGPDVAAWLRLIGAPRITETFDEEAVQFTRMWQSSQGLAPDGVVGPKSRARAALLATLPPPAPATEMVPTPATFIPARYFRKGRRGAFIQLIVIHTMETGEGEKTARAVGQNWFATEMRGKDGKIYEGSTHYGVDAKEIVQYVRESDTAYGAAGANETGIHIEHAGRANQTPAQWADAYSDAMLRRSAVLVADLCRRFGVPIKRIGADEVKAGAAGICGHVDISRAYPDKAGKSPHWDPGPHFPWAHYIELVIAAEGLDHLKPLA